MSEYKTDEDAEWSKQGPNIRDAFTLRQGERISVAVGERVDETPYIVMLARVPLLPSPSHPAAAPLCVIAAEWWRGQWQWMQLSPDTKEAIGEAMEKHGCAVNVWHALKVTP